jgi:hypothetical protein
LLLGLSRRHPPAEVGLATMLPHLLLLRFLRRRKYRKEEQQDADGRGDEHKKGLRLVLSELLAGGWRSRPRSVERFPELPEKLLQRR